MDKIDKANLIFAPLEWFTNSEEAMKGKAFYDALGQKYTVDYFSIDLYCAHIHTVENEIFLWMYDHNKSILIERTQDELWDEVEKTLRHLLARDCHGIIMEIKQKFKITLK